MRPTPLLARFAAAARSAWLLLLMLPAATTASSWHDWDVQPALLLAVSSWTVLAVRLLLPGRGFFVLTYPLALAGTLCVGADLLRQVDLLELAAQWRSFSALDVQSALRPYRWPTAAVVLGLAAFAVLCAHRSGQPVPSASVERSVSGSRWRRHWRAAVVAGGSALCAAVVPGIAWTRAWPANAAVLAASAVSGRADWAALAVAGASGDPGRPDDRWAVSRAVAPSGPETLVLVIGESLRADVLRECGGPAGMRSVAAGSVVACDMTSGSNATHTSVPLLIGRSWPGLRTRIPADSSFLKPLEHLGFHTAWIATQSADVAWPDAREKAFDTRPDAEVLLPALDRLLQAHPGQLAAVLHMTGSHEPYCARFDRAHAPFGDACATLGETPRPATAAAWRAMYANAADHSIGLLNAMIERLSRAPGRVFLAFTPDHGENLLDDARGLYGHALRSPSPWDTRVPAVFWANDAWKAAHPERWARLKRNAVQPLMHADIVPTLMQALQVRHADAREHVVGLLDRDAGPRERVVQASIGSAVAFERLREKIEPPAADIWAAPTRAAQVQPRR